MINKNFFHSTILFFASLFFFSCSNYFKNDYKDTSPTSGKLKFYFEEGLSKHAVNQAFTFESQYSDAKIECFKCNDDEAVKALYDDSCEAILISRELNEREKKAFASKNFFPKFSLVAFSGIAVLLNRNNSCDSLNVSEIKNIISGKDKKFSAVLFQKNSSVLHYLRDSLLQGEIFSSHCNALVTTQEIIDYVSENENAVAFIDFAWLSDADEKINKSIKEKCKFAGLKFSQTSGKELPTQSSFKTKTYPLIRGVYYYRKTGDFSLAKGFESFIAGPKGQLTFLKQGLLPFRQAERNIEVKFEPLNVTGQ